MRLGLSAPLLALFAVSIPAAGGEPTPANCPPFASAVCRGQNNRDGTPCGWHSEHNLAYALRAGHLDFDWVSGLLYNQGTADANDLSKWQWFETPDPDDIDAWCLEDCRIVREDPKRKKEPCADPPIPAAAPKTRPAWPSMVRCFRGEDYTGGIDYSKYPLCGAPPGVTKPGVFPVPSFRRKPIRLQTPPGGSPEEARECTGGNPDCICVKGDVRFNRYEHLANDATKKAFPDRDTKPEGMSDAEATAKICEAFNADPLAGPSSRCRSQNDEIVIDAPERAVDPRYPAVSVDVVTAFGAFWRNSIAACKSGVH